MRVRIRIPLLDIASWSGEFPWPRKAHDWALIDTDDTPQTGHQYLFRRSIDGAETAYYRCYNPTRARIGELVGVAGARWPVEECFEAGKNEVGLDQYQVRTWKAWHRHITFAMLAHTFLAVTARHQKKGAPRPTQPTTEPTEPGQAISMASPTDA